MNTPHEDGFAMPAEWAPHQACLMEWPTQTRAQFAAVFGDREIVPVPGNTLNEGGGGPHCITQQVPAGILVTP